MSGSPLELAPGARVADRYEVSVLLDRSPLGTLYRGRKVSGDRSVFLLVLDPAVVEKAGASTLEDRFRALRELNTRRILTPIELTQFDGTYVVAFEGFDAPTLRETMQQRRKAADPFSLREAAQITQQVLEVAAAMHASGCVARALRPDYIFISSRSAGPKGSNTIIDTRILGGPLWDLIDPGALAEDEYTRGEGQYLAPELRGIEPEVSPRADIYSAGSIFYELLIGEAPTGTYQLPKSRRPDLPREVNTVTEIALAMAPEDRYPTTADFVAGIQRTFTATEDVEVPQKLNPYVWGTALLAVIAIAAIMFNPLKKSPLQLAMDHDNLLIKQVHDAQQPLANDKVRALLSKNPNMVYVPAGPYIHGTFEAERLTHNDLAGAAATVEQLDAFLIDALEYPNNPGSEPKHGVTWKEASETCATEGKRLCTAPELEKACRGQDSSSYAYGAEYDASVCGDGVHVSAAMDACKTDGGVYDLQDNYREWSATAQGEGRRLMIGGPAASLRRTTRCTYSQDMSEAYTDETISFRCCKDIDTE